MAGRVRNRRELRVQAEQAERLVTDAAPAAAAPGKKPAAPRKARAPRAKKAPSRQRVRWGIFDAAMRQVAIFDYNRRADADAKLADLLGTKKGLHFIQIVKEPIPEAAPAGEPAAG